MKVNPYHGVKAENKVNDVEEINPITNNSADFMVVSPPLSILFHPGTKLYRVVTKNAFFLISGQVRTLQFYIYVPRCVYQWLQTRLQRIRRYSFLRPTKLSTSLRFQLPC